MDNATASEITRLNTIIGAQDAYIKLLEEELQETVPTAFASGWRSGRFELGQRCRDTIKHFKEKIGPFLKYD